MNFQSIKYILNRYLLRRESLTARTAYFDLQMHVKTEDVVGRHLYKYGAHEPEATEFLKGALHFEDGDVAIDVGANIGWYSLVLDRLVGSKEVDVFSFEPDPSNFALLEENIALNSGQHIRAQQYAVADTAGRRTLHLFRNSNRGRHSLLAIHEGETVEVDAVTLDQFWASAKLADRTPRFIKMDIEGFELMALRGAYHVLSRCPMVMLEYTPDAMRSASIDPGELLDLMLGHGFTAQQLENGSLAPVDVDELRSSDRQIDLFWTRA